MSLFRRNKTPVPVAPSSVSPTIAIINESTVMTDAQLTPIIAALQIQCDRDFGPVWNATAKLMQVFKGQKAPESAWQLVVGDTSDQIGALGYHTTTPQGRPVAFVFAKTDQQYGANVAVTCSHELLEMIADSGTDLTAQMDDTHFVAFEACDAVEDDSLGYDINGTTVSDFVTPDYFQIQPPVGAKMDFRGILNQPFTIAAGGYLSIWDPTNGWTQKVNGEIRTPSRVEKR